VTAPLSNCRHLIAGCDTDPSRRYLLQVDRPSRLRLLSLGRCFLGRFFPGDSFVLYRHFFDLTLGHMPSWL
jgi:hypothetical protein